MTEQELDLFEKLSEEITERARAILSMEYPESDYIDFDVCADGSIEAFGYDAGGREIYIELTKSMLCDDDYLENARVEYEQEQKRKEEKRQAEARARHELKEKQERLMLERLKKKYEV